MVYKHSTKKLKRQFGKNIIESHTRSVEKNVEFASKRNLKITPLEKQIYKYIAIDNLTIPEIVNRRKTSDKAVYRVIKNLQRKGIIKRGHFAPHFNPYVLQTPSNKKGFIKLSFRYHGCEFSIGLLEKSEFYEKLRTKKNLLYFEGNAIRLYDRSIEVYQNESESFYGDTIEEAASKAQEYFTRLFWKLEDRLKITIILGQNSMIKQVKGHLSEVNNELAREYNQKRLIFKVYGSKDNKLWFHIDNSFNLNEAETTHPETHIEDMQKVQRHFNDIRDNDVMLHSQIDAAIGAILNFNKEYAENFKSHVEAIKTLSESVKELKEVIKRLK